RHIGVRVIPVHWHEDRALELLLAYKRAQNNFATVGRHADQGSRNNSHHPGIDGMDFDEGLSNMCHEPCRFPRARHRVPLVTDAARVQHQWKWGRDASLWSSKGRCNKIRTSAFSTELSIAKHA